jgi:hypothetical protein
MIDLVTCLAVTCAQVYTQRLVPRRALLRPAALPRFELTVTADPLEIDRVYPSLHHVGKGVAL